MSNYSYHTKYVNRSLGQDGLMYVKCARCKGSGIDPDCAKSRQDDEWDCIECEGYGDLEVPSTSTP